MKVNFKKLKGGPILPKKTGDEKEPQKKIFCSKSCEQTFQEELMPRILEENESQLFMGDFVVVKQAARVLQRFTDQLPVDSVFDKMEREKNEKILADFWSLIDQMTV